MHSRSSKPTKVNHMIDRDVIAMVAAVVIAVDSVAAEADLRVVQAEDLPVAEIADRARAVVVKADRRVPDSAMTGASVADLAGTEIRDHVLKIPRWFKGWSY